MEKEKSMTKQETEEMMKQLEKVFSIVRILDVEGLETANSFNKGKMPDHPCSAILFGIEIHVVRIVYLPEY